MSVRSALKTTIDALTLNGESVATFDHGSTQLCIDALERSVFSGLAVLMGDQRSDQEPYCHGWRLSVTEFDVLIAEKRQSNIGDFETYMADLTAALSPSSLGIGNILSCDVTATSEVQHPIPSTWYLPVVVTVKHLIPVTLGSDYRLNADPPTAAISHDSIDSWILTGAGEYLEVNVSVSQGTGSLLKLYVCVTVTNGEGVNKTNKHSASHVFTLSGEGENTCSFGFLDTLETDYNVTFHAVVTDEYGACGVATPYTVVIR